MSSVQLSFALRASSSTKTVHLLGSWDNYSGQLPLAKDKASSSGKGWKGTFRFQGSTLQPGQRYWYYYIIDGYNVSHDPKQASTVEPTTGRTLNVLDVPSSPSKASSKSSSDSKRSSTSTDKRSSKSSHASSKSDSKRKSVEPVKGRPLSRSDIVSPKPVKPNQVRHIVEANYTAPPTVDQLTSRFSVTTLGDDLDDYEYGSSPPSSTGSSLSSRSGDSSSPSSLGSGSDISSTCSCERYGITRAGDRVKLDCGGSVCGYSDESSCSSDDCDDEYVPRSTRRQGVVIKG